MTDDLPPEPWCWVGEPIPPKETPMPKKKRDLTKTEPALVRGFVVSVLSLLAALGVSWAADVDKETIAAIVGVAAFVVPLLQAAWTRRAVEPATPASPERPAIP